MPTTRVPIVAALAALLLTPLFARAEEPAAAPAPVAAADQEKPAAEGETKEEGKEAEAEEQVDALTAVKERGALMWGMDSLGGAPYVFQDPMDPNHLVGFEVDIAGAIAGKLGVKAVAVQGQWDKLLELLERGDFDVAINGIEVTAEKDRICQLSRPYYVAAERLTVRRADKNKPMNVDATAKRNVGTLPGSLAEQILSRAGAIVKTYDGGQNEIYDDLRIGRTDAVLLDDPITKYYGAIEHELEVLPGAYGEVQYAVAVRLNDGPLKAAIDDAITQLAKEGTLKAIYEKWGLWNPQTATALGVDSTLNEEDSPEWDKWRIAVGKVPPFLERVVTRYPKTLGLFFKGAGLTLALSLAAMILAVLLGVSLALVRVYGRPWMQTGALMYVEFFRGTPLLIQLTMIYFGLPELGVTLDPFVAGVLALGLNYAAAEAENYRAGIASVPPAQLDAATVLGLTKWQAVRHVIAPQAVRTALPPATNDFIALMKDSSLVSLVTLTELTKTYSSLANSMRDHLGLGLMVALFYLAMGLPFAALARRAEDRLGRHLRRDLA